MKKGIIILLSFIASYSFYACKKDDTGGVITTPTPTSTQLGATLSTQTSSGSTASGSGTFNGNLNSTTRVLSYTVTYAGLTPTAITLDPVSTSTTSGTATTSFANSILLAGAFPASITTPGSGTSTTPGSGTSTTPGSGTSTTPGSGTSTTPGSGTGLTMISSPLSGTTSLTQSRADSINRGLYRINIRTSAFPGGALGGVIQTR